MPVSGRDYERLPGPPNAVVCIAVIGRDPEDVAEDLMRVLPDYWRLSAAVHRRIRLEAIAPGERHAERAQQLAIDLRDADVIGVGPMTIDVWGAA